MNRLLLVILAVLPFFAGCLFIPVSSEHPSGLVDQSTLDSMIGKSKESILASLGPPNVSFASDTSSYFVYGAFRDELLLITLVWVPVAMAKNPDLHLFCVLLEFDAEKKFRHYKINRHLKTWSEHHDVSDCAFSFFTQEELGMLSAKDADVELVLTKSLREKARQEDRDAQWQLFQMQPTEENLPWLCRAADQGHASARNEIGQLYLYGSEKYRKFENVDIKPDLPRACMWFHLAEKAQITEPREPAELVERLTPYESVELRRTAKAMTDSETAKAKKLILDWEPGQCERDLYVPLGANHYTYMLSLCMAADYGDFSARDELGRAYFFGLHGVHSNLPRAYMWYHLAASVYKPASSIVVEYQQSRCDAMTPEQRSKAVKLLEEWTPGKCEQDLQIE